jgi:hypothetical protein
MRCSKGVGEMMSKDFLLVLARVGKEDDYGRCFPLEALSWHLVLAPLHIFSRENLRSDLMMTTSGHDPLGGSFWSRVL